MKKTYINPKVIIMQVNTTDILAGSIIESDATIVDGDFTGSAKKGSWLDDDSDL